MRRVAGVAVLAVAMAATALVVWKPARGDASDRVTVDAIFDNAAFLTPGSDVRIAGANVGTVTGLSLTAARKARIRLSVDRRFAPFRTDAQCTIQPQSLIGEKFVQCDPGSATSVALPRDAQTQVPTVPLANTHTPVDLDLVLGTFSQPTTARLSLLLDALGNGLSGRGDDLNAALRRANPALQQTQRLLKQLASERRTIDVLTDEADRVVGTLAHRRDDLAAFVAQSGRFLSTTGRRRVELAQTLHRVPPLLDEAAPALRQLHATATAAAPVLTALDRAAAPVTRIVDRVPGFVQQVRPTLPVLTRAGSAGRQTSRVASPQLRRLARLAARVQPIAQQTAPFLMSSEDRGAVDGLLHFVYYATAALARYDSTSHILPAFPLVAGLCNVYATTTSAACDAHFAAGQVAAVRQRRGAHGNAETTPSPGSLKASSRPTVSVPSALPSKPVNKLGEAVDPVLSAVDRVIGALTGGGPRGNPPHGDGGVVGLLDYLLGDGS